MPIVGLLRRKTRWAFTTAFQ